MLAENSIANTARIMTGRKYERAEEGYIYYIKVK